MTLNTCATMKLEVHCEQKQVSHEASRVQQRRRAARSGFCSSAVTTKYAPWLLKGAAPPHFCLLNYIKKLVKKSFLPNNTFPYNHGSFHKGVM